MFAKFSVKKPLTIIVAVIIVIVLGIMSFTNMTPDLLPSMEFPYVIVMTTYPGASPEEVEETISKPLEKSMSTLEKINNISSTSNEDYSTVMLEFAEDANMDSVTINIREKLDTVKTKWNETVGNPFILKISANLMPISVSAVAMDGKDTAQISDFVENTLSNKLEGIEGVASISKSGILEKSLNVVLSQDKINDINKTIQNALNDKFDDAQSELDDSKDKVQEGLDGVKTGLEETDKGKAELKEKEKEVTEQLAQAQADLDQKQQELLETKLSLISQISELEKQIESLNKTKTQLATLKTTYDKLNKELEKLSNTVTVLSSAQDTLTRLNREQLEFIAQIKAIENNPSFSEAQKNIMITAIKSSEEYIKTQKEFEELDELLATYSTNRIKLPLTLQTAKVTYNTADIAMSSLLTTLAKFNIAPEQIVETIAQLDEGIAQIKNGIVKMNDALTQLESGAIGISTAKKELLTQSAQANFEMSSALTEIVSAQSTLKATEKELNTALTKIDSGLEEMNTAKEDALDSANANKTITMDMVSKILTAQNFSMPAGYVEQEGMNYLVRVGDKFTDEEQIEDLMLFDMGIDGVEPIYLTDVADVFIADNSADIYAKINGDNGVILSFTKQSNYPTATVSENINKAFASLEKEYDGLTFTSLMDQGDYIDLIINNVFQNLLMGAGLAIIILLFFLRDIRPTLIIACSIPVSVIFAIVLMYFSGVTLNIISLSGLAVGVGMLVDNSVVVIENIYRLRNNGASTIKASVSGAVQVAGAITSSTLTTICVFLPIVFIKGITRQLFTDMALTIAYSLLASLIVALTLVPAMSQGLLRKTKTSKEPKLMNKFLNLYQKTASFTLRHRVLTLLCSVLILISSMFISVQKGFSFMPEMKSETITVSVVLPEDCTFEEATAFTDDITAIARKIDGVETVGAMVGGSGVASMMGMGGFSSSKNTTVTIYVLPYKNTNVSFTGIAKEIEDKCKKDKSLKDCEVTASTSSSTMSTEMLSGSGVTINIFSDDLNKLADTATKIGKEIEKVDGVTKVDNGISETTPEIKITVDKEKATLNSLTVAQIFMDLSTAIKSETTATEITTDDKTLDVKVINEKAENLTPDDIRNYKLTVTDKEGVEKTVALKDVATITDETSLNSITRDHQKRYITVTAEVSKDKNITLVSNDIKNQLSDFKLDNGVSIEYSGENETIIEAMRQLLLMLLLAVILIYLIMVAQFQSFLSPFIVMFTIPLAFTGGLLALIITNNTLSVISLIGFVMLSGIIVNNGIVLIDYINQLRAEGMEKREAILTAGKTRMRPILMTALTTILGLVTLALGIGSGAGMMQPIAIVCIGGLVYATILTLYIVPIMYDLLVRRDIRVVKDEDLEVIDD